MHRATSVTDHIELSWLATVRWTTLAACVAALAFGRTALGLDSALVDVGTGIILAAVSNVWLFTAARRSQTLPTHVPGVLVCLDVALLAWCLVKSGGVLNPASIFFLVEIVLAALALGRPWTWIVTALSIAGYGLQLLAPTSELAAAASMHPQIAEHMRGMWLAFFLTAIIIGALVTRLAVSIERRDRAIAQMRDDAARQMRLMSLASMAAGAAHELSTPLSTIAVAAGELARSASAIPGGDVLASDINLIRTELTRSRRILTDLSGRADESTVGKDCSLGEVIAAAVDFLSPSDGARIIMTGPLSTIVAWPRALVARALGNIIANALQASSDGVVTIAIAAVDRARVTITVTDHGRGMNAETLARAGEPFFTTRDVGEGTGFGLFVARATAEQLGGRLRIASVDGQGTTVTFDLPIRSGSA